MIVIGCPHGLPIYDRITTEDWDIVLFDGCGDAWLTAMERAVVHTVDGPPSRQDRARWDGRLHPILLRQGFGASIEELLAEAETLVVRGHGDVVLCVQGLRTAEPLYPAVIDVLGIVTIKAASSLPLLVDLTTLADETSVLRSLTRAVAAAGADGVLLPRGAVLEDERALEILRGLAHSAR